MKILYEYTEYNILRTDNIKLNLYRSRQYCKSTLYIRSTYKYIWTTQPQLQ